MTVNSVAKSQFNVLQTHVIFNETRNSICRRLHMSSLSAAPFRSTVCNYVPVNNVRVNWISLDSYEIHHVSISAWELFNLSIRPLHMQPSFFVLLARKTTNNNRRTEKKGFYSWMYRKSPAGHSNVKQRKFKLQFSFAILKGKKERKRFVLKVFRA